MKPVLFTSLCCALIWVGGAFVAPSKPPVWAQSYEVSGTLQLPYAEITEPFWAYYDAKNSRSRVDYYDLVKTIQIAPKKGKKDFGFMYKITPVTTETISNKITCFQTNGTNSSIVSIQAVLPDTSGFKMVQENVKIGGHNCNLWENITIVGIRRNTYRLYVKSDGGQPVRYEMIGYDTLLGSHYDKYYLDYVNYTEHDLTDDIFNPTTVGKVTKCGDFPGPGLTDHRLLMNPMHEYVNHYNDHLDPMFSDFTKHHGKTYKHMTDHLMRKDIFMHNLRFIHSHNRGGHSYSVALNHMADWTTAERRALRGRLPSKGYNGGLAFSRKFGDPNLPDQLDWRLYGAVTPVKDQAVCGSCWSFGTTGTIEGAYFMKTGQLVRLSQQELIDCSWGEGNNGCDGGEDFRAYAWIMKHGLSAEDAYGAGQYLGQNSNCLAKDVTSPVVKTLKAYFNVTSGDALALKMALAQHGPISVAIDASQRTFSFYANGVYYDPKCGNKPDNLDHAVLAVGYGTINGQEYWLVKNSWSTYWGNDGYVLMSQKNNNCGVTTDATFVKL